MSGATDHPIVTGVTEGERRALELLYRAFGEPDLLDQAVTPDWEDIPLAPGQPPGREVMKPMIRGFLAAFPDCRITVHEIIGVPGRAAVRAEITGTHKGEWFGVPPTGRAFSMRLHEFHAFEGDRIKQTWHMEDWFGWLAQIGAWPMKEGA